MNATHVFDAATGRFFRARDMKPLGIIAKRSRGRWQYRDKDTGRLYASGMEPSAFVAQFWGGVLSD